MTNKELADKIISDAQAHTMEVLEAARRLRELPDPAPDLETQMRELVEKHGCLRAELVYKRQNDDDEFPWLWDQSNDLDGSTITFVKTSAALTVIRGIVKAKCDEANRAQIANWFPNGKSSESGCWWWTTDQKFGTDGCKAAPTELAAIDALLTAMEGGA